MEFLTLHGDVLSEIFITVHTGGELDEVVLVVVEFLTLHDDILSKVLVSVHAGGEKALDSWNVGSVAGIGLEETSSSWDSLVV